MVNVGGWFSRVGQEVSDRVGLPLLVAVLLVLLYFASKAGPQWILAVSLIGLVLLMEGQS